MTKHDMETYLLILNEKLKLAGIRSDIYIFGGAVMSMGYGSRLYTHGIDAVFSDSKAVRAYALQVAKEYKLPPDWLNDGVKGFVSKNGNFSVYTQLSNMCIYFATADYMLAMKCLSCRTDHESELSDIQFLIKHLKLSSIDEIYAIIDKYYPRSLVLPKTQYMLLELLDNIY